MERLPTASTLSSHRLPAGDFSPWPVRQQWPKRPLCLFPSCSPLRDPTQYRNSVRLALVSLFYLLCSWWWPDPNSPWLTMFFIGRYSFRVCPESFFGFPHPSVSLSHTQHHHHTLSHHHYHHHLLDLLSSFSIHRVTISGQEKAVGPMGGCRTKQTNRQAKHDEESGNPGSSSEPPLTSQVTWEAP